MQTLKVQSKFEGSVDLEVSCKTWNRLLGGFRHPGQLSFFLHAASETLPTAVNLQRWSVQCDAKCSLCDSNRPTTAHVLSTALSQQRYMYRQHNKFLSILASSLVDIFTDIPFVRVFADLPNLYVDDAPQTTIPIDLLITPYHPDIWCTIPRAHPSPYWN